MSSHDPGPHITGSRRRASVRDAGLATLSRVNHWMAAGAVILAGATSAVTWHAFRAHAAGLAHAAAQRSAPVHHSSDDGGSGDGGSPAVSSAAPAPSQAAPQPAPAAAAPAVSAVSGGS